MFRKSVVDAVAAIKSSPAHAIVNLQNHNFNSDDALLLSKAMVDSGKRLRINLSHNEIGNDGAAHLVRILPLLAADFQLNLSSNKINAIDFTPIQAQKLNPIHINLSSNQISEEVMLNIISFIPCLPPYSKLNLSVNFISYDAIILLSEILKDAPHHFELNLSNTHIADEGIHVLIEAMSKHTPDSFKLILQNNGLDDQSLIYFANILKSLPAGVNLDLSNNYITSNGVSAFAALLKNAPEGFSLHLANNEIDNLGAEEILKNLNGTLPKGLALNLERNKFAESYSMKIYQAIVMNEIKFSLLTCMQLHQGYKGDSILNQMPSEILQLIFDRILTIPTANAKYKIAINDIIKSHLSIFKQPSGTATTSTNSNTGSNTNTDSNTNTNTDRASMLDIGFSHTLKKSG